MWHLDNIFYPYKNIFSRIVGNDNLFKGLSTFAVEMHELRNILEIPNEELQFEAIEVVDDTGQTHKIEGGSPFGVIIRAFQTAGERLASGLQPANANSGVEPNLKVRLPNPDAIPGNIIVRSGYDRLQAYQNENIGDGGMLHPDLGASHVGHLFDNVIKGSRFGPTMGEVGWEHISQGESFPDSTRDGWTGATQDNPIQSSYELHDRTLFFHVTKGTPPTLRAALIVAITIS